MARRRFHGATPAAFILSILLALFIVGPAFAHPGNGNGKSEDKKSEVSTSESSSDTSASDHDGDADSDSETAYTEDNDTNDGNTANNVSDDGDNQHPSGKDRSVENGGSGNQGNSESDPDDDGHGPDRSNGGPDKPNGSGGDDLADQDGNNGCGNDDDFEDDNEGWCGKPEDTETPETETPEEEEEVQGEVITDHPCDSDSTMPGTQPCQHETPPCAEDSTMGTDTEQCGEVAPEEEVRPVTPCEVFEMFSTDVVCGSETGGPETGVAPELTTQGPPDVVLGEVIHRATPNGGTSVLGEQLAAPSEENGAALPFTGGNVLPFVVIAFALMGIGVLALRARTQ